MYIIFIRAGSNRLVVSSSSVGTGYPGVCLAYTFLMLGM